MSSINAVNSGSMMCTGRSSFSGRADVESRFKEAVMGAGLDESSVAGLQEEIKAAMESATKSSEGSTDRRQVAQQAIDGVLKKHGVDLDKFHKLMQPPTGGPRGSGGPPPQGAAGARHGEFEAKFMQAALASGLESSDAESLDSEIQSTLSSILSNKSEQGDPREAIKKSIDEILQKHGVSLDKFKTQLRSLTGVGSFSLVDEQA